MSAPIYRFTVPGKPVPQGSKTAIPTRGRPVLVEGNRAKLKPYRSLVAMACAEAMQGAELLVGPVALKLFLYFPRPLAHYVAGKRERGLRADAPWRVATRPDAEKVARAVCDALTGVAFRDDAQVAELEVVKVYGDPPRTEVQLAPIVALRAEGEAFYPSLCMVCGHHWDADETWASCPECEAEAMDVAYGPATFSAVPA